MGGATSRIFSRMWSIDASWTPRSTASSSTLSTSTTTSAMITREQIFRALQTIAVPVLLGLVARQIWGDQKETTSPSLYLPLLADIDFVPRKLPVTYRDVPDFDAFGRVSALQLNGTTTEKPDVTAVILNWSRFPNVMLITSLLCGPWLEGTIAEVLIWNNGPRKLAYEVCILFSCHEYCGQCI